MKVPEPGTVLVTRSSGAAAWWIRFGAAIAGKPNLSNHVAVITCTDAKGAVWAIEGRPGGVGWRDAAAQPLTAVQRAAICMAMEALIGTAYDWGAIKADAASDVGIRLPGWDPSWHGTVAGQVVCSSAAVYAYAKARAAHPPGERGCQPSDWDAWILTRGWER